MIKIILIYRNNIIFFILKKKNLNIIKVYVYHNIIFLHIKSIASNYSMHLINNKKRGIINTGRFIKIKNDNNNENVDYLVCEICQQSFFTECFNCYCQFCKEMYFSSTLNSDEKKYLLPAT